MDTLQGAVAVVTGGASGIGRSTAHSLARRGAHILVADIDAPAAQTVVDELASYGADALTVRCDVTADTAFEELKASALDRFGRVDLVMNNVGALTRGRPDRIPVEEWQRVIDINLMSVVRSNAVFVPYFLQQGRGHIVNTASIAGLYTYSYDRLPYAASKAALVQLSEGLRAYLRPRGIGVTLLCPGPVRTNIDAARLPCFGPVVATRGPGEEFAVLPADTVGEQVAQAVLTDTFMVLTHERVRDVLVDRASDWNAFMGRQTAALAEE
ncbi:SDR family oxidoreductase [Streptomyces sp. NPDC048291]|uniref:SDR family oxidoreductase n=1 Tax=Streptomyces sp. NPDC048291 TaxID=3365530 RepID=UPI0037229B6F